MRCPTCNRRVPKGRDTCSNCGAFLGDVDLGKASAGLAKPPDLAEPSASPKPESPQESGEPYLELEELAEDQPEAEVPADRPEAPPPTQQPRYAGLLRILFPLIFILIPLINLLVRNSPFATDERPVLQETQFFENVSAGEFSNPRTAFSRSQDERVVLVARWSGARGRHEYSFRWYTPDGNVLPNDSSVSRFQIGGDDTFSAYALLPLNPEFPLGEWRVEIAVDGDLQGQPTFEIQP